MRNRGGWALSGLIAACIVGACVGDQPSDSNGGGGDGGSDGSAGGDGTTSGGLPNHAPQAVAFFDQDPTANSATGTVLITKANDESDLDGYALYYGRTTTDKLTLTPITVLAKTGSNLTYDLSVSPLPDNATTLLAFSQNATGELPSPASTPFHDGAPKYFDISSGAPANSGNYPAIAIDDAAQKILVVAAEPSPDASTYPTPALYRCNLDGTGCTHTDISVGGQAQQGDPVPIAIAIDSTNGKLDVVLEGPTLVRCNLDGTSCAFTNLAAGTDAGSGVAQAPSIAIDTTNQKLLVAVDDTNQDKPGLFRCNLDGSACTHIDISAGEGPNSGQQPAIAIDTAGSKLLVATRNVANQGKPGLFRCNLDGTACTSSDISAGQIGSSGLTPSIAVDTVNGKVLVVTDNNSASTDRLGLFRCNLDGASCAYVDLSGGEGSGCGQSPSLAIDSVHAKLLVVTQDQSVDGHPTLFRCGLDGTNCAHYDFSAGQGTSSGTTPKIAYDAASGRFFIASQNEANSGKAALFLLQ